MAATESPFPQYFDLDGTPLNNGSLYFGVANQNPETNPITVYWDAAGTQPASQPIQTINGYAVRNGTPSIVFANVDYSITVRNLRGSMVFNAASANTFSNASSLRADLSNSSDLSLGVSLVAGAARVVDTIAALKTVPKTSNSRVFVSGYYAAGDSGGGFFWYDSSDTTSSDNGGTIIVANDGGRWKRVIKDGRMDVRFFGAKLDGSTDDGPKISAVLTAGFTAFIPVTTGGCRINTTVTLSKNQWIEFENPSVKVFSNTATAIFRILGNSNEVIEPCGIRGGCVFNMAGAGVNSSAILMGTSSQNVASVRILGRYMFINCYSAYLEETHATNYVVDVIIEDCYCQYTLGRQFYSKRSRGFFRVGKFTVDHTANTYVTNWEGIRVTDFIGFEGDKLDVVGPIPANLTPVYQSAANSMVFGGVTGSGKSALYLNQAIADNTYGNGIIIDNVNLVECTMLAAYQNLGFGIQITDCNTVQITRILETGAVGVTGASAAQQGLLVQGCSDVQINNLVANANTGTGVFINNTSIGVYTNITAKNNTNWGWFEGGTSNSNLKIGMTSYGNTSGSLTQIGASSAACNWLPNSGVFRAADVGAIVV